MMNANQVSSVFGVSSAVSSLYSEAGYAKCIAKGGSVATDCWIEWGDVFARWDGKEKILVCETVCATEHDVLLDLALRFEVFGFSTCILSNGQLEVWGKGVYEEFNIKKKLHPYQWLLLELEWLDIDYEVTNFDKFGCPKLVYRVGWGFLIFAIIFIL